MEPYEYHNQAKDEIIKIYETHYKNVDKKLDHFLVLIETSICAAINLITKDPDIQLTILTILNDGVVTRLKEIQEKRGK